MQHRRPNTSKRGPIWRRGLLGLAVLTALITVGLAQPSPPASADPPVVADTPPASAFAIDVPGSLLTAAAPTGDSAASLASEVQYNRSFADSAFNAVSGSATAAPADAATALSSEKLATWTALTSDFAAPATSAGTLTKTIAARAGDLALPVAGFQVGTMIGSAGSRIMGFKDDEVCSQQDVALTAFASVLDGVDCSSFNNALDEANRNLDQSASQAPSEACATTTFCAHYIGRTASPNGGITLCYSSPSDDDLAGTAVYQYVTIDGHDNWSGNFGSNANMQIYADHICSNAFGPAADGLMWIASGFPIDMYMRGWTYSLYTGNFYKVGETSFNYPPSPVDRVNPPRQFVCEISTTTNDTYTAHSSSFTENDDTLPQVNCPTVPDNKVPSRTRVLENTGGQDGFVLYSQASTLQYQNWRHDYPECANGSCLLDLRQGTQSCFYASINCSEWFTDPNRASDYSCYYGTHVVDLAECFVYAPTFKPENLTDGNGYANPATGGRVTKSTARHNSDLIRKQCKYDIRRTTTAIGVTWGDLAGVTASDCEKANIYAPGNSTPEATRHRLDAIAGHPQWMSLDYESEVDKNSDVGTARGLPPTSDGRGWLNLTNDCPSPRPSGMQCDEFPNFATVQSAKVADWTDRPLVPLVSLRLIGASDNQDEGGNYGAFRAECELTSATEALHPTSNSGFLEIPMPALPTDWICKDKTL